MLVGTVGFFGCLEPPKPPKLNLSYEPSTKDRVVFIVDSNGGRLQKTFEIETYPYKKKFNDCASHLLKEYKDSFATKNSLKNCRSNLELHKKSGKLFFRGTLNLYTGYTFYTFGSTKNQVFNKEVIGVVSNLEDFVYDLVLDGIRLKEGLNIKEDLGNIKILYLKKGKSYHF